MAVNANPLSDTVITEAMTIIATLTGESSQSVTASSPIDAAAASAMVRIGRSREPTSQTSVPQRFGQRRPDLGGRHDRARRRGRPTAIGHQPHQRERPHHGLRNDQQAPRRRGCVKHRRPRYGLARSLGGASARGGAAGRSRPTAHTSADTAHTTAGNNSAAATPWLSANRGITKAPRPTPSGCAVCRMPIDQSALVGREPSDHQSAARRVAAGRRHATEQEERADREQGVAPTRPRTPRRGERRTQGQHDPFADPVDDVTPRDQRRAPVRSWASTTAGRPREVEAAFGVQGRDEEGGAVDEDVRA